MCGDVGCEELLVYCSKCKIYAQHRYCLDRIPSREEVDVYWLCEQCTPGSPSDAFLGNSSSDGEATEEIQKFQHHKNKCASDSRTMKSQHHLRHNAAEVVWSMKSHSANKPKQDGNMMGDSSECNKGKRNIKKRRILILEDDEGESYGEGQSDHSDRDAGNRSTLQVSRPVLESLSPEHVKDSTKTTPSEDSYMLPRSSRISDTQDLGDAETSDISEDRPGRLDTNGAIRMRHPSVVQKQVKNSTGAPTMHIKDKNRTKQRRKLILNDEDEADGEIESDCLDPLARNKSTFQVKDRNHSGQKRMFTFDGNIKEENKKTVRRKFVLDDEDVEEGEIQSDHIEDDGCNKSILQVKDMNQSGQRGMLIVDENSKDRNMNTPRGKIVLDSDGKVESEIQSDNLHLDARNKSILQVKDMNLRGQRRIAFSDENKGENNDRPRRKFIMDDEDEEDGEVLADTLDHPTCNNSTLQLNESVLKSSLSEDVQNSANCPSDENSKDKDKKTLRRKLVLDDEDLEEGEIWSDHLNPDACNKSTVQVKEPLLESSSSEHVQDFADHSADGIPSMPVAFNDVLNMKDLGHTGLGDVKLDIASLAISTDKTLYSPARPIIDHVWRGYFNMCNEECGPLRAHLSNRACDKVWELTKLLPPALHLEKLPRLDAWPKSFKVSPPTDDNIALYFLPDDPRAESILDRLLNDIIDKDLVLKIMFDEAELLVFSSVVLPETFHSFQGKHYAWGVFRGGQVRTPRHMTGGSNNTKAESCNAVSSARSDNNPSTRKYFKLFGMKVPFDTAPTDFPSQQQDHVEMKQKMDDNGAVSSDNPSQNEDDAPFSLSLNLFGSDVRGSKLKEIAFEQPGRTDGFEQPGRADGDEYFGLARNGDVGRKRIEAMKCLDGYFEVFPTEVEGGSLELFPLRGENMATSSKVESTSDLDLKLTAW